jgi:hypothetical protein
LTQMEQFEISTGIISIDHSVGRSSCGMIHTIKGIVLKGIIQFQ